MQLEEHRLVLLRHGQTAWSASGQHTGRTDVELTDRGRARATTDATVLDGLKLDNPLVVSSPRRRALGTAELAGLTVDEVSDLLAEWDYGDYEGLTTAQIRTTVPNWTVWTHPCPGGETTEQIRVRADRAVAMALDAMASRDVVFVGHGHFSRAVIARWVELPVFEGSRFAMTAGSIAVCGFEHGVRQLVALGLTGQLSSAAPA